MTLQASYKSLNKKQKGLLIQAIIAHANFTKSREWLRKYLRGIYPKLDKNIEEIGLNAVTKIGVSTPSLLPFRLNEMQKSDNDFILPIQSFLAQEQPESMLKRIYDENINVYSVSKIGKSWLRFGRICNKDLHKINPFKMITHLIAGIANEDDLEGIEELKLLYEQHLHSTKAYLYMPAWELFSQKSRFIYFYNPFRAIQSIIHPLKN